jgi:Fur family ferric uptake transcriptional regulator/Fur family zinc uptake transcriptional regulator
LGNESIDCVVADLLGVSKLRATKHRKMILTCLVRAMHPLSHTEIQTELQWIDRVTIYRALTSFFKTGIVHKVYADGSWRFCAHHLDTEGCQGNHPHFLCTICGTMICLSNQRLDRLDVPGGYEVEGKQFVIHGKCPNCLV